MVPFMILFIVALLYGDYFLFERGYQLYGRLLGEAFSGIFLIIVVAQLALRRRFDLPPKYVFWSVGFFFIILAGAIANDMSTGAVVMGIRENFKYAPLFLLPIVYKFDDRQIKTLLLVLLFFGCLQLPYMVHQRITEEWATGDYITGTLLFSNNVSVFLICSWAILFGCYLRKRVTQVQFVLLSITLLLPTTLNETKGSLVLLPLAFFLPLAFAPDIKRLGVKLIFAGGLFALLAIGFSTINTFLIGDRGGTSILDLFLNPDRLIAYLMPAAQGGSWMGRLDKLLLAWEQISQSSVNLLLGVGLGNVNDTSHEIFAGEFTEFGSLLGTTFNQYLWETGIIGVTFALMFPIFSFFDARRIVGNNGLTSAIANGWLAVAAITFVSVFYIRAPDAQAISYLFFFVAGHVAARAYQLRIGKHGFSGQKSSQAELMQHGLASARSHVAS